MICDLDYLIVYISFELSKNLGAAVASLFFVILLENAK